MTAAAGPVKKGISSINSVSISYLSEGRGCWRMYFKTPAPINTYLAY